LSLSRAAFPAGKIFKWKKMLMIYQRNKPNSRISAVKYSSTAAIIKERLWKINDIEMNLTQIDWCTFTDSFSIRSFFEITMLDKN
jgi:hypothetical protein